MDHFNADRASYNNYLETNESLRAEAYSLAPDASSKLMLDKSKDVPEFSSCSEPSDQWKMFYQNEWNSIKQSYIDPSALKDWDKWEHKFDSQLCTMQDMDTAIKLMAQSLHNQWTQYSTAAEQSEKEQFESEGNVASGMELSPFSKDYKLEFMHYGSPAQQSELREGDLLRSINGIPLRNQSIIEAKRLASGEAGEDVEIEYERNGQVHTTKITLAKTPEPVVEGELLKDDIAHVRLPDFNGEIRLENFLAKIRELRQQTKNGLNGFILDLRNDPGGDFPNAVSLSSMFLPDDNMEIATSYVRANDPSNFGAMREQRNKVVPLDELRINHLPVERKLVEELKHVKMAVLVNGSSVSASELFTGSMQDNHRATIIGTQTFGKGVGYRTEHLPSGGILKITALKYLTPAGRDINGKGITPDKLVEDDAKTKIDEQLEAAWQDVEEQRRIDKNG